MKLKIAQIYSQRDPRWSSIPLGFNTATYTIGTDGCLITTLCNYANSVGFSITPDVINQELKDNAGFVNGGFLVWGAVPKVLEGVKEYYTSARYVTVPFPDKELTKMRSLLDKGYLLITEIDFNPSQVGEQMHWVATFGYDNGDFTIADPWTGKIVPLSTYGVLANCLISYKVYDKTLPLESDTPDTTLKDTIIDFDDGEGNRHPVGWYVYEWFNEKKKVQKEIDDHNAYVSKIATERQGYKDTIAERDATIKRIMDITSVLEDGNNDKTNQITKLTNTNTDLAKRLEQCSIDNLALEKKIANQSFTVGQAYSFLTDALKNGRWK